MPSCCVAGCRSSDRAGISLHRLPVDDALRSEWIKAVGSAPTGVRPVVCDCHFDDNQFISVIRGNVLCTTASTHHCLLLLLQNLDQFDPIVMNAIILSF